MQKTSRFADKAGVAAEVCRRIASGEPAAEVMADPAMPSVGTWHAWMKADPTLAIEHRKALAAGREARRRAGQGSARGSPGLYTPLLGEAVVERLAASDGGLEEVLAADGMPSQATVYRWLKVHPEFAEQYAWAREVQAHRLLDRVWPIVRDATPQTVRVARLQASTVRWLVGKLAPRRYGATLERPDVGADDPGLTVVVRRFGLTDEEELGAGRAAPHDTMPSA